MCMEKRLEALYEDELKWIEENLAEEDRSVIDEAFKENWFKLRPPGFLEHRWN